MIIVTQCIDGNRVRVRSNLSRELVSTLEYRKMTMDAWLVQDFDVIGRTITYPTMISQHHSAATHSFSPLISSLYIHTSMSPITSSSGLAARRLATSVPLVGRVGSPAVPVALAHTRGISTGALLRITSVPAVATSNKMC